MKHLLSVFFFLSFFLGSSMAQKSSPYIHVDNGHFVRNGSPYYYIGTNFWYGAILGSEGEGGNRARLIKELDYLQSLGIDNLRVLVGADGENGVKSRVEPTLQKSPGIYNDTILAGLDYLMQELGKRKMVAVLYLNNSWEWSGGYSLYLQWAGYGKAAVPSIDGWNAYMAYVKQYQQSDSAKALFRNHVNYIITRTNRYTGKKYVDDPAIMSWQVGNEPRAFSNENKAPFARWIADVAAQIKSLDKNHMVSTGSEGLHGCEEDLQLFEQIHAVKDVDYINIHVWPYNWGWVGKNNIVEKLALAKENTKAYVEQHMAIARKYQKPLVMEEFGFPRDGFQFGKESTTVSRDSYYQYAFELIIADKKANGLFAGCNFWGWGGFANPSTEHAFWQKGDDYSGDPAQEEQGLNSVFATDKTVQVIKESILKLNGVGTSVANKATGAVTLTKETQQLLKNLRKMHTTGFMFGHQDDTAYGIGWDGDKNRSDVKSVCGDYPAVCGWDLGHIELGDEKNLDNVPFDRIRQDIIAQYNRGGLNTVTWHLNNPLTGGDAWDVKDKGVVTSILPGGEKHELYLSWLDKVALFFNSLTTADGTKVPVLFRPFHEHTGSWFWWGRNLCTTEQYKELWIMTHEYLSSKGVDNLLYAYAPGTETKEIYIERYPGDEYVDLIGFDNYPSDGSERSTENFKKQMTSVLTYLTELGKEHDKPIAVTETGLVTIPAERWWTEVLFPLMDRFPVTYVLVWRNAFNRADHFYAPYPGQVSAKNFVEFYKMPKTLFCKDVTNLYK